MNQPENKHNHPHSESHSCCSTKSASAAKSSLVKDPVCGMTIDPLSAKGGNTQHNGETFYFCNPKCKTKFEAEPLKYLSPHAESLQKVDSKAVYTCPMHPEVRQKGAGNCPICGMTLVKKVTENNSVDDNSIDNLILL